MQADRREFMKLTGTALAAAGIAPAAAQTPPNAGQARGTAKGLTLLQIADGQNHYLAVKTARGVLNVAAASKALNMGAPATMDELLQNEDGPRLNALVAAAEKAPNAAALVVPEAKISYAPVVSRPGKIVCVGLNYRAHTEEMKEAPPKVPVLFNKYSNTLLGHNQQLKLPVEVATNFDYEVELVIIMGRRAKNVSEADALSYVAGYAVGNDFTARDLQYGTGGQWMVGKTLDGFAPIGPQMVTADQIDPRKLRLECRVNGQTRQDSDTSYMVFNNPFLVSYISRHMTLDPGDIIFTGTPSGVINGMPPEKRVWLKAGDTVTCSVERLGELTFRLT